MANRNLEPLKVAAKLLEPVLDELVFVGGAPLRQFLRAVM
jgi:hypothetical protein